MIDVKISYVMALKLEMYMEEEIKRISQNYRDLAWKYDETCKHNEEIRMCGRSFYTDYGINQTDFENMVKNLRIRQYELYLELEKLIKHCKDQNGGKPYLPYSIHLKRELICFNSSYDNVAEELERLKLNEVEEKA